jgi:acyl-coenzyme A synthetase/AMP-(fatty) acid ligase
VRFWKSVAQTFGARSMTNKLTENVLTNASRLFPPGVKLPADFERIPSKLNITAEVLDKSIAAGWGRRCAFIGPAGAMSYDELYRKVCNFAAHCAALGIDSGDRVLLRMSNCFEFPIAFLGLVKIGAVPVLQNSANGLADVEFVLAHSDAVAAVTLATLAEPLRQLHHRLGKGLIVAGGAIGTEHAFEDMVELGAVPAVATADTSAEAPAMMCYTSGTTGKPKGIVHAHRWIIGRGDANRLRVPPLAGDVVLASGEWSFISLLGHNVLFALRNGVTGAVIEGRVTPEKVLQALHDYQVTVSYAVPTIYRMILAREGLEDGYDLSRLRGCNASGEALGAAALAQWKQRFGVDIWEHYGVSEMQMVIGHGPVLPIKPGSVGVAWGVDARIVDENDVELPRGAVGQLVFGTTDNPSLFLGYHKDPAKTAEVIHGGWFHTGDLAMQDDDGYFWISGRNDDCFKSKGIFITPIEIENALLEHPAVEDACVVPLSDGTGGNLIRAVVVARDLDTGSVAAKTALTELLRNALKARIARNKVPHVFDFVAALPKSSNNKVLRRSLPPHEFPSTS